MTSTHLRHPKNWCCTSALESHGFEPLSNHCRYVDVWKITNLSTTLWQMRCKQLKKKTEHIAILSGNSLQAATGWAPSHLQKRATDPMGSMRSRSPDGCDHREAWPISRNRLDDAKFLVRSGRCFSLFLTFCVWLFFREKEEKSDRFMSEENIKSQNSDQHSHRLLLISNHFPSINWIDSWRINLFF